MANAKKATAGDAAAQRTAAKKALEKKAPATRPQTTEAPAQQAAAQKTAAKKTAAKRAPAKKVDRWSQHVNETSDALDLQQGVFKLADPKKIAQSLKRSAEHSDRRKADPFRSAMSMLNFYVNRAGHNLAEAERRRLDKAKDELRALFDRPAARAGAAKASR